jgi:hypothetical protein
MALFGHGRAGRRCPLSGGYSGNRRSTRLQSSRGGSTPWSQVRKILRTRMMIVNEGPLLAQSGRFASEPEAVALDCALRSESPPNSRPSMVCLCRASCFCRLLSSYRCCRSSRRLRRLTDTAKYDRAVLRGVQKNVSGHFRRTVEPVRVIKCAVIDTVYCWKSF